MVCVALIGMRRPREFDVAARRGFEKSLFVEKEGNEKIEYRRGQIFQ